LLRCLLRQSGLIWLSARAIQTIRLCLLRPEQANE
jgi:hypothetical protein